MPLTIYFAGAISGGRVDVAHYRAIVQALEADGHRVLAGAVASEEVGAQGESLDAAAIFARNLGWIREAAVLVAEVSLPSTGVGYEVATARYAYRKPVICLYRPAFTKRCSAMVAGDAGGADRVLRDRRHARPSAGRAGEIRTGSGRLVDARETALLSSRARHVPA